MNDLPLANSVCWRTAANQIYWIQWFDVSEADPLDTPKEWLSLNRVLSAVEKHAFELSGSARIIEMELLRHFVFVETPVANDALMYGLVYDAKGNPRRWLIHLVAYEEVVREGRKHSILDVVRFWVDMCQRCSWSHVDIIIEGVDRLSPTTVETLREIKECGEGDFTIELN